jgi:hypothetical protein
MSARPERTSYFVSIQAESMILPLWRQGKDTLDIARALSLPEHEIANRLLRMREKYRQMCGGGAR